MGDKLQSIDLQLPYLQMGSGFMIGLSTGYFLKKSFKALLILMGLVIVAMFVLESQGVITINESSLDQTVNAGTGAFKHLLTYVKDRLDKLTIAGSGSAVAGFFVGLKWG